MPTNLESSATESWPAACRRASASSSWSSGWGMTQRRCSLVPTSVQYAASTEVSRTVGITPPLACSSAASMPASRSGMSSIQYSKPSWTVMSRLVSLIRSCRLGPSPGAVGEADDAGLLGGQGGLEDGAQVAGRVAVGVLHLQAEPDVARVADHRRRGAGEQGGEADRAAAVLQRERRGGGGDQLAQRDHVALARACPRRGGRRRSARRRRPHRGRPCSACPSRRGRAGGGRPRRRRRRRTGCGCGTSWPWPT